VVIHAAPNDIPKIASATEATTQDVLVSTESKGDGGMRGKSGFNLLYRPRRIPLPSPRGLLYMLQSQS